MKKYKLIAIDIDGTLLNDNKEILPETLLNIKEAYNKNVVIAISTGRGYPASKRYVNEINLNIPLILYNGSRIRMSNDETLILNKTINNAVAKKVYELIEENNGTCCFWKNDKLYFNKNDDYTVYYENLTSIKPNILSNVDDEIFNDINKFIWFGTSEELEKIQKEILVSISGIDFFKSQSHILEIVPTGVNKGNAVSILASSLGIKPEEVIAIGDDENDISMIKYAGLGVAMGNAKQVVKNNADYITLTNNENGVGEVIKKFIL